jgi:hypothetical protein
MLQRMPIESGTAGFCIGWTVAPFESKEHLMVKKEVKRWSQQVTETSNALDLEEGVFSWDDPRRIARSLKWSADNSDRRRSSPFRSAMSMLNFYVNRAGKKLPHRQREILEKAKEELRELYGKPRRRSS